MYKANIEFMAFQDDWNEGESLSCDNRWFETVEAETSQELKDAIVEATYQKDFTTIERNEEMEDEDASIYLTSYLADGDNQGDASEQQIELWKAGKEKLWAVQCNIHVTFVTESKAVL